MSLEDLVAAQLTKQALGRRPFLLPLAYEPMPRRQPESMKILEETVTA